jgi:hypothetical protein
MWGPTFLTLTVVVLLASQEPRDLWWSSLPFTASALLDVDELYHHTPAGGLNLFGLEAIVVVGGLEVWGYVLGVVHNVLRIHGCQCSDIVGALRSCNVLARGAVVHFMAHYLLRVTHPGVAVATLCAATLLMWAHYAWVLRPMHGNRWAPIYSLLCKRVSYLNIAFAVWIIGSQELPLVLLSAVNALVPGIIYLPTVVATLQRKPGPEEGGAVEIELNPL